jgi:hypothetical protein
MLGFLAVLFFAAAILVQGAAFTVHSNWLDWQSLMLAGFLCLALGGAGPWFAGLRLNRRPPP